MPSFLHVQVLWALASVCGLMLLAWWGSKTRHPRSFALTHLVPAGVLRARGRHRIEHPWLWALRLMAWVLGILAVARPFLGAPPAISGLRPHRVVVVLDNSASMALRLDGATLSERAKERVRNYLIASRPSAGVSLIVGPTRGPVSVTFDDGLPSLERAWANLSPPSGTSDLGAMLRQADTLCEASPKNTSCEVLLATDARKHEGQNQRLLEGWHAPVTLLEGLLREPNATLANAAIQIAGVKICFDEAGQASLATELTLTNFGAEPVVGRRFALIAEPNIRLDAGLVDLAPFSQIKRVSSRALNQTGPLALKAELAPVSQDGFALDDQAFAVTSSQPALVIWAVGAPRLGERSDDPLFFLEQGLAHLPVGDAPISLRRFAPEALAAALGDPAKGRPDAVVLAEGGALAPEATRALSRYLEAGGGVLWLGGQTMRPEDLAADVAHLLPVEIRDVQEHPRGGEAPPWSLVASRLFYGPDLRQEAHDALKKSSTYRRLVVSRRPEASSKNWLEFVDGAPALVVTRRGLGQSALLTTQLAASWSDLAVSSAFVPVLQHSLLRLAGRERAVRQRALEMGSDAHVPCPGPGRLMLRGPDGSPRVADCDANGSLEVELGPLELPGIYHASFQSRAGERFEPRVDLDQAVTPTLEESDFSPAKDLLAAVSSSTLERPRTGVGSATAKTFELSDSLLLALLVMLGVEGLAVGLTRQN